jgi:capsular exopolysaccharide synthesis family protein
MGRVYQALVKAGRVTGEGAPRQGNGHASGLLASIGSVAVSTEIQRAGQPLPTLSFLSARTTPFSEPKRRVHISSLKPNPHLAALADTDRLAGERYHTLAVRILGLRSRRELKTLLVTSAGQKEGKTTVALNLAWVLSKPSERRVLLLEADLRRPAICRLLGMAPGNGWLEVLTARSDVAGAVTRIDPNGLHLLTASPCGDSRGSLNAAELLASSRLDEIISELREQFDFVIIDAPAISEFADAQRLASIADGTMMVARAGRTTNAAVTEALKLVPQDRRVGVVLNESDLQEELDQYRRNRKALRRAM